MKIELAIKFGSNEIIVYRKGMGIVLRESTYVAMQKSKPEGKIYGFGNDAKRLCELKPSIYELRQPIQGVDIVNAKLAQQVINEIMHKVVFENGRVTAIVAVPCALSEKKLLELKLLLCNAGINSITFVQNSVCARMNLQQLTDNAQIMVVDIGKYLTDVSILDRYNFVNGYNYVLGGREMDEALAMYIEDNYSVSISNVQAESIKDEISTLHENDMYITTFKAVDINSEFKEVTIKAKEVRVAIVCVYDKIFSLIEKLLEDLPDEVVAQVKANGIVFVGGASSIDGLTEYATKRLNIPVTVIENPKDAVILGAGKLLSLNKEDYPYIKL